MSREFEVHLFTGPNINVPYSGNLFIFIFRLFGAGSIVSNDHEKMSLAKVRGAYLFYEIASRLIVHSSHK